MTLPHSTLRVNSGCQPSAEAEGQEQEQVFVRLGNDFLDVTEDK